MSEMALIKEGLRKLEAEGLQYLKIMYEQNHKLLQKIEKLEGRIKHLETSLQTSETLRHTDYCGRKECPSRLIQTGEDGVPLKKVINLIS